MAGRHGANRLSRRRIRQVPHRRQGLVDGGREVGVPCWLSQRVTAIRNVVTRMSSGPVTSSALAWLMVWVRSERALRLATISARIASTAPSRPLGAPQARPDKVGGRR